MFFHGDTLYRQYVSGSLRFVRDVLLELRNANILGQEVGGHETESSQEVWYVLAFVTSPYREGWGLFVISSRHPQCC